MATKKVKKLEIKVEQPELRGSWVQKINKNSGRKFYECSNCGYGTIVTNDVCPKCNSKNR